jgi:hypothetical protein
VASRALALQMKLKLAGQLARMETVVNAYTILVAKPEEKKPFERPSRRCEDNFKIYLKYMWGAVVILTAGYNLVLGAPQLALEYQKEAEIFLYKVEF